MLGMVLPGKALSLEELPDPAPGLGELRIRVGPVVSAGRIFTLPMANFRA
jgi:hypothetical protein